MKKTKKILYIILFFALFICIGTVKSKAGYLSLNQLDFNVQINNDGSMDVTEIWNIYISETNTLYKTFKTDKSKYSEITNVTVSDITYGKNSEFIRTSNWTYHVAKNYYYGTKNEDGDFEIGWGVGLDNQTATRKYEISYTVKDAITKYNDYAELYWQFVGENFEISSKKITGTIYLPTKASNIEDIKVWGHTKDLNGTIYATDTNKIEFGIDNYRSGRYVEIRTLFPANLISSSGRVKNTEILQTAITEETKWADKANARRKRNEFLSEAMPIIILVAYILINLILIIVYIRKAIKYSKKNKELKKYEPTTKLEYYRDLPDEQATPGEAVKILNMELETFTPTNFGKIFSATMLNLALKGYIEIKQEKNEKGKETINIYILRQENDGLKPNEGRIMSFIRKAAKNENTLTLKELEKYIKNHPTGTDSLLKQTYSDVKKQLIEQDIIDKQEEKEYQKYKNKQIGYIVGIIFLLCFTFVLFIIPAIILIIDAVLCGKIAKKINVLTQKGVDQKEEWKGLKKYMEDFSMLDKKEVPELVIWEKYLVFATAFGIANKVIKQLKIVYPNFEEITTGMNTYSYMYIMMNTNFSTSFSNAIGTSINSSIASTYSSGSGGGGGFSGGGGFGRRPEVAADGR